MGKSYEEQINNAMYNTLQEMTPLLSLHDLRELQRVMVKNFAEATNSDKHQPTNEEYIAKYFAAKKIEGMSTSSLSAYITIKDLPWTHRGRYNACICTGATEKCQALPRTVSLLIKKSRLQNRLFVTYLLKALTRNPTTPDITSHSKIITKTGTSSTSMSNIV